MVGWVMYALLLIFAPGFIHKAPNQTSGIAQVVVAFVIGHLLDRALGFVRRRRAMRAADAASGDEQTSGDAGGINTSSARCFRS
jgi:hypothetical protein